MFGDMKENMFPHFVAPFFHLGRPCFGGSADDKFQWKRESLSMTAVGNNEYQAQQKHILRKIEPAGYAYAYKFDLAGCKFQYQNRMSYLIYTHNIRCVLAVFRARSL